jgi:uncharacterized membrane protein YphA (DoxX/SURF4 family)
LLLIDDRSPNDYHSTTDDGKTTVDGFVGSWAIKRGATMNTGIWIVQVLLAVAFGIAGIGKLVQPYDALANRMKWVNDLPPSAIRVIGALELAGAIGLILPGLTGILSWLTPLAAVGLGLTMIGAMALHVRRTEYSHLLPNFVLLALAVFVAYGRFVAVPLS